jgi:uroporphyrinogen III methyltransferase/synthase
VTVYLVGAGPGDPGLITRRGAEVLARADVVVYDRLVPRALVELAPPGALRLDVGKRPGASTADRQEAINAVLVEHGRARGTVVRLKGGDPFVFGRGGEEALALRDAGVVFEVVPGVSSAFAVAAYGGVPVTHRGLSSSVTVVTGKTGDGDAGGVAWEALAAAGGTIVVLMGMEHRAEIARRLIGGGRDRATPVLVVHRGSTPAQQRVRTTLAGLGAVELGPPSVIVVGAVAGLDLDWFAPGPLTGVSVVVTRAESQSATLGAALSDAGASVRDLPLIAIAAPPDGGAALRAAADRLRAGAYDWVVCTSANAVDRLVDCLRDGRDLGRTRIAAVGPATSAALARRFLVADLVPGRSTAEGLVEAMPTPGPSAGTEDGRGAEATGGTPGGTLGGTPGSGRVLYPRAVGARPVLAAGLRAKGWAVDDVDAYQTASLAATTILTEEVLEEISTGVVTFTSPSTVRAFVDLVGGRTPAVVACIGPITAEAARHAGWRVDVVADEHSVTGLVDALVAHRGPGPPSPPA